MIKMYYAGDVRLFDYDTSLSDQFKALFEHGVTVKQEDINEGLSDEEMLNEKAFSRRIEEAIREWVNALKRIKEAEKLLQCSELTLTINLPSTVYGSYGPDDLRTDWDEVELSFDSADFEDGTFDRVYDSLSTAALS